MPDSVSHPYRRIASLKNPHDFANYAAALGLDLNLYFELSAGDSSPLQQPYKLGELSIGNRFCILPMEGWDGTDDGRPSDLTIRRWRQFGESGAKLIWGGEAVAVRHDARANPNQLLLSDLTVDSIEQLRHVLISAHKERY